MKTYYVELPISGKLVVEVQAESEKKAIDLAMQLPLKTEMIEEWDVHRKINTGNVCHAIFWDAKAELIDDGGEE